MTRQATVKVKRCLRTCATCDRRPPVLRLVDVILMCCALVPTVIHSHSSGLMFTWAS